ncbi:hypothetical protein BHM03_00032860 [Ensete ventricosum]|nr:hypothetical protein BHM03_00032860 [Ensete ventricosum]
MTGSETSICNRKAGVDEVYPLLMPTGQDFPTKHTLATALPGKEGRCTLKKPSGVRRLVLGGEGFMMRRSDLRVRLVARWAILAVVLFSFPCVQAALLPGADVVGAVDSDDTFLPVLLRDMRRRGLLRPEGNVVIFDDMITGDPSAAVPDSSTDFVFSSSAVDFRRIDRILKAGGVVAVRSGSNPPDSFLPPANYRTAYVGRIGSDAVVAMRKSFASGEGGMRLRRLLSVPAAKKNSLRGLESAMLEPPTQREWQRRARHLPELTGDELEGYPRRVFVEVAAKGEAGSGMAWFERNYPRKGRAFEEIRVEVEEGGDEVAEAKEGTSPSLAEWLQRNVREEEYVVVKAEAGAVEEAMAEGAIGLVDELFLECDHQLWDEDEKEKGARRGRRRAYWECLVLYGKLRDAGVAVHQWWSF